MPNEPQDAAREQWYMALSYLWILFIIPLLRYQFVWHYRSAAYGFHLKQGVFLFSLSLLVWLLAFVPYVGPVLYGIGALGLLFLSLSGFLRTWHGDKWTLPGVGRLIKAWKF